MTTMSAQQILDREYLEIRAKILEIAASFDRIQRAEEDPAPDVRRQRLEDALRIVLGDEPNRAEQIQLIFSRDYEQDWQSDFKLRLRD